eukprot:jgi/Mesvir1/17067/Mv06881-RA.1
MHAPGKSAVTVVDGGQSAIDWLDRNGDAVDLVLTDVNMPNVDGFAVLKHIKSSPVLENVPVIMVSPRVHRALTDRCASLGADGCVAKPIPRPYVEQLCQHVHQRNVSGAGVRNVSGAVSAGAGGSIGAAPDAVFRDGGGRAGGMVRRRRTHACSRCSSIGRASWVMLRLCEAHVAVGKGKWLRGCTTPGFLDMKPSVCA